MTTADAATELRFEPPGPGPWQQDPVHFPRPLTRYFMETHPAAFKQGTNDFARFYGMLIDGLQIGYVNGFGYNQVVPAPDAEIPERFARAEEVYKQKLWREQLRDWDENRKPAAIAKHRELQAVDPDALSDEELVAYLTRCRDHHAAMIAQHMRFTAGAVLPDRRLPRARHGVDRPAASRAARPHARRGAGVRRWLRRARAPEVGVCEGSPPPARRSPPMPIRRKCSPRCARSAAKRVLPSPAISIWSATGCSTGSTSANRLP